MKENLKKIPFWAVLLVIFILGFLFFTIFLSNSNENGKEKEIGDIVVDYIDNAFFQGQIAIEHVSTIEVSGVYEITIRMNDEEIAVYATKDKRYLFPEGSLMQDNGEVINREDIGNFVVEYIDREFFQGEVSLEFLALSEESGVYRIMVRINEDEIPVYSTEDGKYFFPEGFDMQEEIDLEHLEQDEGPITFPSNIENFVACLNQNNFKIYGADWCPHCQDLVDIFGGYDLVDSIYVECTEQVEICDEEDIKGYPTITLDSQEYQGERSLQAFAQATNCDLEY